MRVKSLLKSALLAGAAVSVLSVYSCGGGGGGGAEPVSDTTINGLALDGYLQGSTVIVDCGSSKIADVTFGDPGNVDLDSNPDTKENFSVKIPKSCVGKKIYVKGGLDVSTGLAFPSVLVGEAKNGTKVTTVSSIIYSSTNPEAVKTAIKNLTGIEDPLVDYVGTETNPEFLKLATATATALQVVANAMGSMDKEKAEKLYAKIGEKLVNPPDNDVTPSAVGDIDIISLIIGGIAEGLQDITGNDQITDNDINGLKEGLATLAEKIDNDGIASYDALLADKTMIENIVKKAEELIPVKFTKFYVKQINVNTTEGPVNISVDNDGNFSINVPYDNDQYEIVAVLKKDGDKKFEDTKANIIVSIKPDDEADKRSAIIRVKNIDVEFDNDGNISGVNTNQAKIQVTGTSATGRKVGPVYITADNDVVFLSDVNEVGIKLAKLINKIKSSSEDTVLKDFDMSGKFILGVTVEGLPVKPIYGDINF